MIKELRYIGLTDSEIEVYEALLALGETTTGPICSKTGKQNSTVYYCLNSLIEDGLVSYVVKGKTKHYRAADPDLLLTKMDDDIAEKRREREELEDVVDQLEAKKNRQSSKAIVYEGDEGFKTWLHSCQQRAQDTDRYYTFVVENGFNVSQRIRRQLRKHNQQMQKAGLTPKLLVPTVIKDTFTSYQAEDDMGSNAKVRYSDDKIPSGTIIFGDTLTHVVVDEVGVKAFMMHNEILAKSYAEHFESLWLRAADEEHSQ
jgi:sugar-specific transcriptional regulator TrmB